MNPLVEHLHLLHVFVVFIEQVNIHCQGNTLAAAFLFSVHRDTCVHRHAIHPRLNLTLVAKFLKALPQMNQCLLKEIINLILVFGEHIADTIYRALLLLDQGRKFFFFLFHILFVLCFCLLDVALT